MSETYDPSAVPDNTRPEPPPLPTPYLPSTAPPPPGTAAAAVRGTAVRLGQLPPPPPPHSRSYTSIGNPGGSRKARKLGWGFWIGALLFLMLIGALFIGFAMNAASNMFNSEGMNTPAGLHGHRPLRELVLEGSGPSKIVVIPVDGVIMSTATGGGMFSSPESMVERVTRQLDQAANDPHVKAVVLTVDSPGGGVTASDVIYNEVLKLKQHGIKVVVHMEDICASGGYYISAPADKIIASPTTITGSIGVIMHFYNAQDLMEKKLGLTENTIQSGEHKDIGSYARPMTPEEIQILQGMVDEMYLRFVNIVSEGRHNHKNMEGSLDEVKAKVKKLADGRIYSGTQAEANGLADAVGYFDDALKAAQEAAGLKDKEFSVVQYKSMPTFADILGSSAQSNVNVNNGIQLDARNILQTHGSQMEYRWDPGH